MRPSNTIEKMRTNAWRHMGKGKIWDCVWLGEDYLAVDDLCVQQYLALKAARKGMKKGKALEQVAAAMHKFEELFDLGAGETPAFSERPPEITAELRAKYGEIIEG